MYELFKSNEQDESLSLLQDNMSKTEAMQALRECEEPHCQIEQFDGYYHLIATKHNKIITKYY